MTRAEMIAVHKQMRAIDQSELWPICGKFNVTERAINWARREEIAACCDTPESYKATLESRISEIVNDSRNW